MTSVRVRDLMTKDVIAIGPDVSIRDAMALLSSRHISGAPVTAGGKIVEVSVSGHDAVDRMRASRWR